MSMIHDSRPALTAPRRRKPPAKACYIRLSVSHLRCGPPSTPPSTLEIQNHTSEHEERNLDYLDTVDANVSLLRRQLAIDPLSSRPCARPWAMPAAAAASNVCSS
jgi:hypothetical protein